MFLTEDQFKNFQPINDRVLIGRIGEPEYTHLIIPDIARKPSWKGVILAVGPGKMTEKGNRISPEIKVGDIVYFHGKWNDLENAPPRIVMCQEADVLVVCEGESIDGEVDDSGE